METVALKASLCAPGPSWERTQVVRRVVGGIGANPSSGPSQAVAAAQLLPGPGFQREARNADQWVTAPDFLTQRLIGRFVNSPAGCLWRPLSRRAARLPSASEGGETVGPLCGGGRQAGLGAASEHGGSRMPQVLCSWERGTLTCTAGLPAGLILEPEWTPEVTRPCPPRWTSLQRGHTCSRSPRRSRRPRGGPRQATWQGLLGSWSRLLPLVLPRAGPSCENSRWSRWQRALLKDYQEEGETWLPGERGVRGPGRKPSAWLPWFPRAGTCMVTVHSPGAGPGGHACKSPEGEGGTRARLGRSGAGLEPAPGESWVGAGLHLFGGPFREPSGADRVAGLGPPSTLKAAF